ncbi:MAG TPA: autotransporter domain-containing protein [Stellaceae bacterium]|jgi:hypothetical protein
MELNKFHRSFLRISAVLCLIGGYAGQAKPAFAQQIVTTSIAGGTLTAQDSAGDTYTATLAGASGPVVATFTPAGGPTQTIALNEIVGPGGAFSLTGVEPSDLALTCTGVAIVFSRVTPGTASCSLAPSPGLATNIGRSLAASTQGELRSQSSSVNYMITDRLRSLARSLAASTVPGNEPTPPGGTVVLPDFSSNPSSFAYGGASAGSPDTRLGMWGNASGSYLENDTGIGYNGASVVGLAGMDYILDRQWIVGFAAGYTHADLSLKPSTVSHQADGALIGPYVSYIINPHMALDALFNYTSLSNSLSSPVPLPSGNYHSDRLTGTSDLNVFTDYGPFKLTGYAGYTYSWEGGNVASVLGGIGLGNNIRYGAIRLGGEAAYPMGQLEAYVPVMFEYETTRSIDESSRAALVPGIGLRYRWSDTLSGGLLFQATEIKTHTQDYMIGAHLRWTF